MKALWITLGVIALIVLFMIGSYNSVVSKETAVDVQWANVETVLQRRFDLIPNLVNTVKGYASHEKELLEKVTELRSQWAAAGTPNEKVAVDNQMKGVLGRLMLVAENYPQLKANQNFLALQDELAGTENRISVERRRYNEAVGEFNKIIRRFPGVIWANTLGLEKREPFKAAPEAQAVPQVKF